MATTTISPNMNMPVPNAAEDPGPNWAQNLDACLSIIDSHNHSPGQGVPITPDAMNINDDLSLNGNNATNARSVRFSSQSAALSDPADLGCIYEVSGELFYNDAAGNQVQLTLNGSPAGGAGTITGLPSGTASASFFGSTFTFESATNTPATMSVGPVVIAQPVVSGFSVTITPSVSQAADYDLTLPITLPLVNSLLSSDASGNLSFVPGVANVRTTEGSGTTTLTNADNPYQIFNLSADRVVKLPTTGIVSGQKFTIQNVGADGALEVQSSNTNTIGYVDSKFSKLELTALVGTPTTSAHWLATISYTDFIYSHGGSYNGGFAPTLTGSGLSSVSYSFLIPYQLLDGSWRLRFNFAVATSTASRSSYEIDIAGMTFYDAAYQPISSNNSAETQNAASAITNSPTVRTAFGTISTGSFGFSGDVALKSKPTWAY